MFYPTLITETESLFSVRLKRSPLKVLLLNRIGVKYWSTDSRSHRVLGRVTLVSHVWSSYPYYKIFTSSFV